MNHDPGHDLHDALQDAVVIKHSKKGGDKQNRRQHFEGEHEQEFLVWIQCDVAGPSEIAKDKFCAFVREINELNDEVLGGLKSLMHNGHLENEHRQGDL